MLYGLAAYLSWGFIALYFRQIKMVPAMLILGQRVIWSAVFLTLLLGLRGELAGAVRCLANRRTFLLLLGSTALIGVNWYTFIWSIEHNVLVEASFGYFINPLVNVALGVLLLKERMRAGQMLAIALAAAGVLMMTWAYGRLPVISLILACSFGLYGLLRKIASVGPLIGLALETYLLLPLALGYVWLRRGTPGGGLTDHGAWVTTLLVLGGVVTAGPLIWFAAAARRLRLATLGFIQYLAPTCQLMLAVLAFGEPFTAWQAKSFGLIWLAILIFSVDSILRLRNPPVITAPADPADPGVTLASPAEKPAMT